MLNSILLALLVLEIAYYIKIGIDNGKRGFPTEKERNELHIQVLKEQLKTQLITQDMAVTQKKFMGSVIEEQKKEAQKDASNSR